ncbi:MAG: hypothetical protein ACRERV_11945 [Methylococcales bacterium]
MAQGIIESFNIPGESGFPAYRMMMFFRNDMLARLPTIRATDGGLSIGHEHEIPQCLRGLSATVAKLYACDFSCVPARRQPNPWIMDFLYPVNVTVQTLSSFLDALKTTQP